VTTAWRGTGTYFESCNCDAICPCRTTGGAKGGASTHGVCDFALSWWIKQGSFSETQLDGWEVALLVDERASPEAQRALEEILLGKDGIQAGPGWPRSWSAPMSTCAAASTVID